MSGMSFPIHLVDGDRRLVLDVCASRALPWREVAPAVRRAAGLSASAPLFCGVGLVEDEWLLGYPPLVAGVELGTAGADRLPECPLLQLTVVAGPDAGATVAVGSRALLVGRCGEADLRLTDPQVSLRHARLTPAAGGVRVGDLGSTNGVFVDGVACATQDDAGSADSDSDGGGSADGDGDGGGAAAVPAMAATGSVIRLGGSVLQLRLATDPVGELLPDGAGRLVRPVRTPLRLASPAPDPVRPEPPSRAPRRALPWISVLVGVILGGVLAALTGSAMFLAFAALGPLTMVGSALADRWSGRRSGRAARARYRRELAAFEEARQRLARQRRQEAWRAEPGPAEWLHRARIGAARLWERTRGGPLYLTVAIGAGADDTPASIALPPVLAVTGVGARGLVRWILTQVACAHLPSQVAVVVVSGADDLAAAAMLPHLAGGWTRRVRTEPSAPAHPGPAGSGPSSTVRVYGEASAAGDRDLVAIVDGPAALGSPTGRALLAVAGELSREDCAAEDITRAGRGRRVSVICLTPNPHQLPAGTPAIRSAADDARLPIRTSVSPALLRSVCAALAPLREPEAGPGAIPVEVRAADLWGPVDAASLARRWSDPAARAVIGVSAAGAVEIDLDRDGPHVLIAGTTGAGKSELLQTMVAALAATDGPDRVTFLLVDYKGGAAFAALAELPHVVGVVTDLDPHLAARALTSLAAEIRRREELAARGERAPRLVVVVDEFATLAVDLPDFLTGLLDVAQRGRSLGVHLVLATQRPAGIVSPAMRANIAARICLRVTDPADSQDVIAAPDAAALDAATPGRAILRTGTGLVTFQTARAGMPASPPLRVRVVGARHGRDRHDPPSDGSAQTNSDQIDGAPTNRSPDGSNPLVADRATALDDLTAAARAAAAPLPVPVRPWREPLPERYAPAAPDHAAFALADEPGRQRQGPVPAPAASALVTGPPGSGRSATLRRLAALAAARGEELLVVDAAGGLADLAGWASVSTYLDVTEPHLVLRLVELLIAAPARVDGRRHLVVDHFDQVAAALDEADYRTGSALLARLAALGDDRIRISAAGPESLLHGRSAVIFPEVVQLQPRQNGTPPGRAQWHGTLHQIAVQSSAGRPCTDRAAERPVVVRALPAGVSAAALPAAVPRAVPIGIGGDAAEPVTVDLTGRGAVVVAGPRGSGVTAALATLVTGALAAGIPVLRLVHAPPSPIVEDLIGPPGPGHDVIDISAGDDAARAALAAHDGPLLLVADHGASGTDHPGAALMERFCQVAAGGQVLLVGARTDVLARSHRGHLRAALSYGRGLLLCPDTADGGLFDIPLPRRTGPLLPGRGWWTDRGRTVPVQVADPATGPGERPTTGSGAPHTAT